MCVIVRTMFLFHTKLYIYSQYTRHCESLLSNLFVGTMLPEAV